jgi:hypothetical protein
MKANITHTEYENDYRAGWDAAREDIRAFGINKASDKWRSENPVDVQPFSLGAYYYAKGGLNAIVADL